MAKKLTLWLGISLVCFTAFVMSARATEKETVSLANVDGQVEATLELPWTPTEEIVALQLSFRIESGGGSIGKEDISFAFDAGLPGDALQQCRYQEDTGILTIYISGNQDLYPKGQSPSDKDLKLSLGRVVVNSDKTASVKVVKNSFKTVNRAHGMYEGEVNTGDGGQTINNGNTGGDTNISQKPGSAGNDLDTSQGGSNPKHEGGNESTGEDIFLVGEQQGEKVEKEKNVNEVSTTGIAKKLMDAAQTQEPEEYLPESDPKKESQEEPVLPEDSLWEEGAKLWKEKTGSVSMDVWTKVFFGLFAVSASVAGAIGIGLAVRAPGKRKRRRRRRRNAGRNRRPATQARAVSHKSSRQSAQKGLSRAQTEKPSAKRESIRSNSKAESGRKNQSMRSMQNKTSYRERPAPKAQGKPAYKEQPAWKDNKKSYVRKRRKIS